MPTPEERAESIVSETIARSESGWPSQWSWKTAIAAAIREAVAEERDAAAKLCGQISADERRLKLVGDSFSGHHAYAEMVTDSLARAIRARGEQS